MIRASDSSLLIIDLQEKLVPAIEVADHVIDLTLRLVQAARRLNIPVMASEQYVKGLGPTDARLAEKLEGDEIIEKAAFGCTQEPGFLDWMKSRAQTRKQIILTGTEAHVCVLQTALGLQAAGYEVYAVTDAIGSRKAHSKKVALRRMEQAGIVPVTFEMVVFEWLQRAATEDFRALRGLVK